MTTPLFDTDHLVTRNQFESATYLKVRRTNADTLSAVFRVGATGTFGILYDHDGRVAATGQWIGKAADGPLTTGWTPLAEARAITIVVGDHAAEGDTPRRLAVLLLDSPDSSREFPRWSEEVTSFYGAADTNATLYDLHTGNLGPDDVILIEDLDILLARRPHVLDLLLATGARIVATASRALAEPHPDIEYVGLG